MKNGFTTGSCAAAAAKAAAYMLLSGKEKSNIAITLALSERNPGMIRISQTAYWSMQRSASWSSLQRKEL